MIVYRVVAYLNTHLLGEPAVVRGVRGRLPRHAQLGQRPTRHARRPLRQLRAQGAVIELIHFQTSGKIFHVYLK